MLGRSPETITVATAMPPSWGDRAKGFVKARIIDEHSPRAHERKILDRITRLAEGPNDAVVTRLARRLKPTIERHSYHLGVAQTVGEVTAVVAATAGAYVLAERTFPKLREQRQRLFYATRPAKTAHVRRGGAVVKEDDAYLRNLGVMTTRELNLYNAAVRAILEGMRVEELLSLDPILGGKMWREQRALRERMFRFKFIDRAERGYGLSEQEMGQFFRVLEKVVLWARNHSNDVNAQLADIATVPSVGNRAHSWEELVRWVHRQSIGPGDYLIGGISDPEFFPMFLYELELHLGRFGDIPRRIFGLA